MTIYVDELFIRGLWRYGASSHLLPDDPRDPKSIQELHDFAVRIGLRRDWFQEGRWPHYDCARRIRGLAVKAGAVEIRTIDYIRARR